MRRLATLIVGVMLAVGSYAVAGVIPGAGVMAQSGYSPDAEELAFVDLLNGYRGSLGLAPVALNDELGAAADYHSIDMAANNYFDHYLFDGTDPGTNIQNFGYVGYPWGENIAAGMGTAQEVLIAWQNSPEHNATMTNPNFTEVGIGRHYGEGTYYGWYWTATYGGGEAPQSAPVTAAAPLIPAETADGAVQTRASETTTVNEAPSVVTNDGGAVELEQAAINADGDRAYSSGGNPVADGEGEAIYVGDINTGGVMGETIVYEEPSLNVTGGSAPAPVPAATTSEPPPLTTTATAPTTTTAPPPAAAAPVVTDSTLTETTVTDIQTNDGNAGAYG